ncbi:hypothetical protein BU17DRAFT_90748 [Hysterangium stoloniferum]|nr:hypothetical protein BU17DRAFT_90748 [Hysterangium stoloniferum]
MTFIGLPSAVEGLQCKFKLSPYTYDLCALIFKTESLASLDSRSISRHIHIHNDILTPSSVVRRSYDMDLGGEGLPTNRSLSVIDQCPLGTWICLKVTETFPRLSATSRKTQTIPVTGNIKHTNANHETILSRVDASARLLFQPDSNEVLPSIEVTLNGGHYNSQMQKAIFIFRCDETVEEPSNPVSALIQDDSSESESSAGTDPSTMHAFTWSTKHACPVGREETTGIYGSAASPTSPPSDASDPKDEETIPETPLKDDGGVPPAYKAKSTIIIAGSLVIFSLVAYGLFAIYVQRRKQAYSPLVWGNSPTPFSRISYIFPTLPFSTRLPPFLRRSSPRKLFTRYDPLIAEEYEIQDQDGDVDGEVVDFQRQALLDSQRRGYGTVR